MKKLLLGTLFLALASIVPNQAMAELNISIGVSLPPLIQFRAPPDVIVIPDTDYVYAVPDIGVDMYFWNGWWWRLWEGRWYRSHYYDRGWGYYGNVPSFYFDVDPGWRRYYRDRDWYGHRWDYQRIPNRQLQRNWRTWNTNRYWERRGTWGVQNYQPKPRQQRQELRQQRQKQYRQRPEVRKFQQQRQRQVQQPQNRHQSQPQRQPRVQQPQRKIQQQQQRKPQVQQPQRKMQQQQQRKPQVQRAPRQMKPLQQRQYKVQKPQRQEQPKQQKSQPQHQNNRDKSDRQQSHGKPDGRSSEGRR